MCEAMKVREMVLVVVSVPIQVEGMFKPGDTEAKTRETWPYEVAWNACQGKTHQHIHASERDGLFAILDPRIRKMSPRLSVSVAVRFVGSEGVLGDTGGSNLGEHEMMQTRFDVVGETTLVGKVPGYRNGGKGMPMSWVAELRILQ